MTVVERIDRLGTGQRRGRWRGLLAFVIVGACLGFGGTARAGLRETFEAGNRAYWEGDYQRAIEQWERLVELGVWDADVFYNLGTAYAREGRIGPAILNFERALLIDPGNVEARENLQALRQWVAHRRTEAGEDADLDPPRTFWMSLLARVTPMQVTVPFLICWVGFFLMLSVRRLTEREVARLAISIVAVVLGAGAIVGGALVAGKASYDHEVREAIATRTERAPLYEGPGEAFHRVGDVREGDRLRVLDREGEWMLLRDQRGLEGWGRDSDFGELRPPPES